MSSTCERNRRCARTGHFAREARLESEKRIHSPRSHVQVERLRNVVVVVVVCSRVGQQWDMLSGKSGRTSEHSELQKVDGLREDSHGSKSLGEKRWGQK